MSDTISNNTPKLRDEIPQNKLESRILSLIESTGLLEIDFFNLYDNLEEKEQKQLVNELYHWMVSNKITRHYDSKYINYTIGKEPNYHFGDFDKRVAENRSPEDMESLHDDKLSYRATVCWVERKKAEIQSFKSQLQDLRNDYYNTPQPIQETSSQITLDDGYTFPEYLIDKTFDIVVFDTSYRVTVNLPLETLTEHFKKELKPLSEIFDDESYKAFLYNTFQFKDNPTSPTALRLQPNTSREILKHHIYTLYFQFKGFYSTEKEPFAKSLLMNFPDDRKNFPFLKKDKIPTSMKSLEKSIRLKSGYDL